MIKLSELKAAIPVARNLLWRDGCLDGGEATGILNAADVLIEIAEAALAMQSLSPHEDQGTWDAECRLHQALAKVQP